MMGKLKHFFQRPLAECEMEAMEDLLEKVCCGVQIGCVSDLVWMKCLVRATECLLLPKPCFQSLKRYKLIQSSLLECRFLTTRSRLETQDVNDKASLCWIFSNLGGSLTGHTLSDNHLRVTIDTSIFGTELPGSKSSDSRSGKTWCILSVSGIYVDPEIIDEACNIYTAYTGTL